MLKPLTPIPANSKPAFADEGGEPVDAASSGTGIVVGVRPEKEGRPGLDECLVRRGRCTTQPGQFSQAGTGSSSSADSPAFEAKKKTRGRSTKQNKIKQQPIRQ